MKKRNLEERIRHKMKKQHSIDELNGRFDVLARAQKDIAKAFRETLERVNKDFDKLKARVEKLENPD